MQTKVIDSESLNTLANEYNLLEYIEQSGYEINKINDDTYMVHCPLHIDNHASLSISPKINKFHCFSCGVGGNILSWMIRVEHLSFNDAIDKFSRLSDIDVENLKTCESLRYYKSIKKIMTPTKKIVVDRKIIPYSEYQKMEQIAPKEWLDEGITAEVMREYDIRVDDMSNRICYPVYDNDDNLIGIKGRTRFKKYKELGIMKYMNYYKIQKTDYFCGMNTNRQEILAKNSVVIFEGIKSGLKMCSFGLGKNWLAAETSYINDDQIAILLKLHISDVTIAFDSDVDMEKLSKSTKKLARFTNVYVIRDTNHLLGEKESPVDRGKEVWQQLFSERKKI